MCNHYFLILSVLALLISLGVACAWLLMDRRAEWYEVTENEYRRIVKALREAGE